ncbi:hypothetical protein J4U01_gp002 [Mycobacterium phage Kumao]|uniref:DUF3846 domain-containing protein n=1 Tax=Mycobacterium phage Kumao TaxID=2041344 RepID=A0A2D1GPS7_9CAUD|nr:hypothetical protein J4U01_gp002 [Mycobacterium phage Kumao]ATN93965.1 hypothetical protein SEA_KUMAO_2 [Mycobacterium phage Kumao]
MTTPVTKPIDMLVIEPDGTGKVRELSQDIRTLQGLVGGYLEALYARRDEDGRPTVTFLFNEEGMIHKLAPNPSATMLLHYLEPDLIGRVFLLGTVIVVGGADDESDMLPVPPEVVAVWER